MAGETNFTNVVADSFTGALSGSLKQPVEVLTGNAAIASKSGLVILNKGSAIAATLADPTATTDDGKMLTIVSITAQAHTVTSAGGFNGAGASGDVGTFGAAIGNGLVLVAYQGKWYVLANTNVTIA